MANYLPARISVFIIAGTNYFLNKDYRSVLETAKEDGQKHTSPNAGYPESAFAGALGVQLGGSNIYHGKIVEKPVIGKQFRRATFDDVQAACRLMEFSSGGAVFAAMSIAHVMSIF
jgi:adenosylcobinamide-phosphate synthase